MFEKLDMFSIFIATLLMIICCWLFCVINKQYISYKSGKSTAIKYCAIKYSIILLVSLVPALRVIGPGLGGTDANNYHLMYMSVESDFLRYIEKINIEPGLALFFYVLKAFNLDYNVVQFIYYLIFTTVLCKVIEKTPIFSRYKFSFLLYVFLHFVSFCLMRNNISVVMGWLSLSYLLEKKNVKSVMFALIALSIHSSAIVLLFVIICYNLFFAKTNIVFNALLIIIVSLPIIYGLFYLFIMGIGGYRINYYMNEGGSFAWGNNIFKFIFLAVLYDYYLKTKSPQAKKILLFYALSLVIIPLQLVLGIMYRMTPYFDICIVMALSVISKDVKKLRGPSRTSVTYFDVAAAGYFMYYFIYNLIISFVDYGIYSFELIFL